ncbi:VOC family protein, partial [Serratia marcescens]|nr:VOC family protein [Serratia marcescens]
MTTALTKAGFWRKTADSSSLREPRVLIRVYVGEGEIDRTIAFYEQLHGVTADMRFDFPEHRLVLAAVGPFLILEGAEEQLRPFRSTVGTLLVDDI